MGLTSRWMAAARARESQRSDRLFDDPLSSALSGPKGFAWLDMMDFASYPLGPGPGLYSVVRTRFFDEFLAAAIREVETPQVVLLAAGMDARAFRMQWPPGTRLYEVDLPEVLESKEELLTHTDAAESCERRVVGTDLAADGWVRDLGEAGHNAEKPTVWLAEGILLYLAEPEVRGVLAGVDRLSAPKSRLGADLVNRDMFLSPSGWPILEAFSWLGSPPYASAPTSRRSFSPSTAGAPGPSSPERRARTTAGGPTRCPRGASPGSPAASCSRPTAPKRSSSRRHYLAQVRNPTKVSLRSGV